MPTRDNHYLHIFRAKFIVVAILTGFVLASVSCGERSQRRVLVVGSTSVQPFAEVVAHHFTESHPEIRVDVQGGGSTAGIRVVRESACDIGASSRGLKEGEGEGLEQYVMALDGIAVIVHCDNPVDDLTHEQARQIFEGAIRDWSEVGGKPGPIYPLSREDGSGTFGAFRKLVMGGRRTAQDQLVFNSNGAIRETVSGDPAFVGYISLGLVNERVKALKINGVFPTNETITNGTYPFVRPFLLLTKGKASKEVGEFLDYVLGPEGQQLLEEEGLTKAMKVAD